MDGSYLVLPPGRNNLTVKSAPCLISGTLFDMTFSEIAAELSQVVQDSEPLLHQIRNVEATFCPAPGKWSKKEIIAHLIDSASNNHQRFVRAGNEGKLDFPGYDQEKNISLQNPNLTSWELLIELWSAYNRYLAYVIGQLPASAADAPCCIGGKPPVTLLWIAGDYVEHLKHHLNQVIGSKFPTAGSAKA
jgi:hypothetical protein